MKILHVITSLRTGGAEKLMIDLIPKLKESGHDVDLLLFDGINTPFKEEAIKRNINVISLNLNKSVYSPSNLFKLIPYLRRYDIIHTHNTSPQLFAAVGSVLCSVVLCTTEHNTSNRRRGWKWYALLDKWMYNRYNEVICISQKVETHLRDFIGSCKANIQTIDNGVDTSLYCPNNYTKGKSAKNTHIFKLVQVAGFREQKDQDTVIKALNFLPEDVHLYLVGDGFRKDILLQLISQLNLKHRVHLMGIRSDIPEILHSMDVVVMSSHWEGFGLAAVEGMAAGKPVIATDVDGLREVVKGAGLTFELGNSKELADLILQLKSDNKFYSQIASRCYERSKQFDISNMAAKYLEVYSRHAE